MIVCEHVRRSNYITPGSRTRAYLEAVGRKVVREKLARGVQLGQERSAFKAHTWAFTRVWPKMSGRKRTTLSFG
jgi:hypothetical protein